MLKRASFPHWLLRRADQTVVAALVVAALAAIVAWWVVHGGWRSERIEIDRADPLTARFEVDINQADWPELVLLPRVGVGLAKRIVESRKTQGPFVDAEDLRRVHGLGPKTLEQIRPFLRPMASGRSVAGK
ncbi:MAG: helix-hairpin-helix domain-containing protein [Thermoguttaceae bacterium]